MSKNFSVVLNVVLVIAVAFLYYAHYSSAPVGVAEITDVDTVGTTAVVDTGAVDTPISYVDTFVAPSGPIGIAKVAYVNIDIILRDYALVTDFQKVLATETKSAQAKVKRRVDAMQVEYGKMQEESRYWTQEQMAEGQGRLAQMEQEV